MGGDRDRVCRVRIDDAIDRAYCTLLRIATRFAFRIHEVKIRETCSDSVDMRDPGNGPDRSLSEILDLLDWEIQVPRKRLYGLDSSAIGTRIDCAKAASCQGFNQPFRSVATQIRQRPHLIGFP